MIKSGEGSVLVVVFFTEKCNLKCKYCYIKQSQKTMSWEYAQQSVDFIAGLEYEDKTLCFMGGEPLVEWVMVKKMTEYAYGKGINRFNLCTNMTLIDSEKIDFFIKNRFNIMLSIDGSMHAHNAERENHNGRGSFDDVEKAVELISERKNMLKFTIQMCITPLNIRFLSQSFKYLLEKKIADTKIYLIPIVDPSYKWNEDDYIVFAEEKRKMLVTIEENSESLPNCKIIFGKCCSPYGLDELRKTKSLNNELCLCKDRYYGIDIDGNVYYCFFSGFSKYKKLSENYKIGDVWNGITQISKLNDFSGEGMKRCMSCLAWNYVVNKDVRKPAEAYEKLYSIWLEGNEK